MYFILMFIFVLKILIIEELFSKLFLISCNFIAFLKNNNNHYIYTCEYYYLF